MTTLALAEKKDREVGPSSCCPGAVDRWSDPCNAAYCEACDRWATPPAVIPVHHGPTWERDPDTGRFIAPKLSLGPVIDAWVKRYIKSPDGTGMWEFTREQRRMLYWIYAIDEHGRWLYRELNIQRLKGWGKDPFAALLSLVEMVGPCRPVVKDGKVVLDDAGNPVARRQSSAWVQVFAVALAQTKNTMKMFSVLASPQLKRDYTVVIGKEQVVGLHGEVTIEAVTSSPETREGNRPTFQIGNEALALDTPIPTPTGWTTMGDLRDGDVIFGSDGRPTTVVKAQPVRLGAPCYRVTFEDGTSMVASDDHRWFAQPKGPYKTRVWTTREMVDDGRRFYIPRAGVRQTAATDLPVDPYLLGAWLGDGSTGQAYIASAWGDVDTLREQLRARGIETTVNKGGSAARVGLSNRRGFGSEMGTDVAKAMRSLDCWRDKHIPTQYLRAGTEQRAELLRGLMDTDGCATTDGKAVFVGR